MKTPKPVPAPKEKITQGSTVTLRSGGYVMTVERIYQSAGTTASCVWMMQGGELRRSNIPVHCLCLYKKKPVA